MQTDKNFTEHYKLRAYDVHYIVSKDTGVVIAKATFGIPFMSYYIEKHSLQTKGIARVNKEAGDTFDVEKGKRLARARAEKEAFIQYKLCLLKQKKEVLRELRKIDNTIDMMNINIQCQNEYIKSF